MVIIRHFISFIEQFSYFHIKLTFKFFYDNCVTILLLQKFHYNHRLHGKIGIIWSPDFEHLHRTQRRQTCALNQEFCCHPRLRGRGDDMKIQFNCRTRKLSALPALHILAHYHGFYTIQLPFSTPRSNYMKTGWVSQQKPSQYDWIHLLRVKRKAKMHN